MADHICESLANTERELVPGFTANRQRRNVFRKIELYLNAIRAKELRDLLFKKTGNARDRVAARIDAPNHFSHALGEIARSFGGLSQTMNDRRLRFGVAS